MGDTDLSSINSNIQTNTADIEEIKTSYNALLVALVPSDSITAAEQTSLELSS